MFLNLLRDWKCDKYTPRIFKTEDESVAYFSFTNTINENHRVFIHIKIKLRSFRVEASTSFIMDKWIKTTRTENMFRGSQGRRTVKQQNVNIHTFHSYLEFSDEYINGTFWALNLSVPKSPVNFIVFILKEY